MADWIADAKQKMTEERSRRQRNVELAEAQEAANRANSVLAFNRLVEALQADIELFNKHFSGVQQRLKQEPIGDKIIQIERQHNPSF